MGHDWAGVVLCPMTRARSSWPTWIMKTGSQVGGIHGCGPPSRSLLPHCSLKFRLLDLLQQGLDVAWQGLPQGILVDPLEIPTNAEQEIPV